MIFKLHLTREELAFLAVAVEEREKIITHFLSQDQETRDNLDPLPFDPDPLTDAEREKMSSALERSAVIAEKIRLLKAYADQTQEVIKAYQREKGCTKQTAAARYNAMMNRKAYLKYALNGISSVPDLDPELADLDLEIPDP